MRSRRLLAGAAATAAVLVTGALSSPVGAEADDRDGNDRPARPPTYTVLVEAEPAGPSRPGREGRRRLGAAQQQGRRPAHRAGPEQGLHPRASASPTRSSARRGCRPSATRRAPRWSGTRSRHEGSRGHRPRSAAPPHGDKTPRARRPPAWTRSTASCGACGWCAPNSARTVQAGDKRRHASASWTPGIDARNPDLAPNFDAAQSRNFVTDIPDDRRAVRVRELQGPGRLGRLRPRHARRRHGRRRGQRLRHLRCRAERHPGRDPRRPGQRLPVPRAGGQRADVRRGHRPRRHQHVVLRRPVALQLHRTTRPTRAEAQAEQRMIIAAMNRALNYAHRKGVTLVGGARQQPRGPRQAAHRHLQPGLPAGHARTRGRSTTRPASTCRSRARTSSASRPSARRRPRPTTPTTASSRSRSRRRAAGSVTASARRRTAPTRTRSCRRTRSTSLQVDGLVDAAGNITRPGVPPRCVRRTARPAPRRTRSAATTPTCRARRWPHRTPPVSPR